MNKSDMFEYIGEGNTLYDKIEQYFPSLDGDFSTANLLNHLKEQYGTDMMIQKTYKEKFDLISNNLLNAIKRNEMTPVQEYDLLLELKSFDGESYRKDSFSSVEEYVDFARFRIDDSDTQTIQQILIRWGVEALPQREKDSIRDVLLETVYMPKIHNSLKTKYNLEQKPSEKNTVSQEELKQRAIEKTPELEDVEKAYNILKNPKFRKIYDSYLKDYEEKQIEVDKRLLLFQKCAAKREIVVTDEMKSTMGTNEKNSAIINKNLLYQILGAPGNKDIKRGKYEWQFKEYEQPQIALNCEANYSENGIENQKVIVVKHGRMNFKGSTGVALSEELIGVTRIGADKERTYFVAIPVGTLDQISQKEEEFYSKIFFSDYYLEQVETDYNRFAGTVIQKQGKPKIVKEAVNIMFLDERDALNYAQRYNGDYKSRKTTLEDMCHPHGRVPQKHKAIVNFIKEKDSTEKPKIQEDDKKTEGNLNFSDSPGEDGNR